LRADVHQHGPRGYSFAVTFCSAVAIGTLVGFLSSVLLPSLEQLFATYSHFLLAPHTLLRAGVVLLCLILIAVLNGFPQKLWRSLELGLVPVSPWVWAFSVAILWVAYDKRSRTLASASVVAAALLNGATYAINKVAMRSTVQQEPEVLDPDLPVPEYGKDLLRREAMIDSLVSTLLLESPPIVAVTGRYGDGKTSFINLTIGKLRESRGTQVPVIVRFSPWLAGDSNALVRSLLNSTVAEVKSRYLVPGLSADAARYARVLLSTVPRTERLKEIFSELSQEERIDSLVNRIATFRRWVLIVLDDLDRMQAEELETILKILRGSDKLSNTTFLCAFSKDEVAQILKKTRPIQDTDAFIEKFFPVILPLPEIDSDELQEFFRSGITRVLQRHSLPEVTPKAIEQIWQRGAGQRLSNLRRVKLFLNKIGRGLDFVGHEVNIGDFIRLQLIRDIAPDLYEKIYQERTNFWNQDLAFEARLRAPYISDKDLKELRAEFYKNLEVSLSGKPHALLLLNDLFPKLSPDHRVLGDQEVDAVKAEKDKRIFHPRCFRQYFVSRVPSEFFPREEFDKFSSSLPRITEEVAAEAFSEKYQGIAGEDFKQWHFMNLIDLEFGEFAPQIMRGLSRGMARNSSPWSTDDFRSLIAVRSTLTALVKTDNEGRREFLRKIIDESESDLYTLSLVWTMDASIEDPSGLADAERFRVLGLSSGETGIKAQIKNDLEEAKRYVKERLRKDYPPEHAPSVFEQFGKHGMGGIAPIWLMFAWHRLGPDAEREQQEYLRSLFATRPQDIDEFLKLMFRVHFIDDYTALKPLIDYKELAKLIAQNEEVLDRAKVVEFRRRRKAESDQPTAAGTA